MQFDVPQFIEIEDKIFGPFTFKQFVYMVGGAGTCYLIYNFVPFFFLAIILMIPVGGFALALAFYKVNDKPFIGVVEAAFNYMSRTKLYIWKKEPKPLEKKDELDAISGISYVPKLSDSKLKDLSWSLDVLDNSKKSD